MQQSGEGAVCDCVAQAVRPVRTAPMMYGVWNRTPQNGSWQSVCPITQHNITAENSTGQIHVNNSNSQFVFHTVLIRWRSCHVCMDMSFHTHMYIGTNTRNLKNFYKLATTLSLYSDFNIKSAKQSQLKTVSPNQPALSKKHRHPLLAANCDFEWV